jgi:hypothetical protein
MIAATSPSATLIVTSASAGAAPAWYAFVTLSRLITSPGAPGA